MKLLITLISITFYVISTIGLIINFILFLLDIVKFYSILPLIWIISLSILLVLMLLDLNKK